MIRFVVKAGLAGTAVYYVNQQNVWKSSNESAKTYEKLKSTVKPYFQQAVAQLPFELPQVPETENPTYVISEYWNKGVMTTFQFLVDSPDYAKQYSRKGWHLLMENSQVKEFIEVVKGSEVEKK